MEKLQIHIVNDYSGSMLSKIGNEIFYSMVSFRENIVHPFLHDVLEKDFDITYKYYYCGMGKVKTFNKKGDPIINNNSKYKTVKNCGGIGDILSNIKKIYRSIKNMKGIIIVLSDTIWCASPSEIEEFYTDTQLDSDFMLFVVNLNPKVRLEENVLFQKVKPSHINLVDHGCEEQFEAIINEFLKN